MKRARYFVLKSDSYESLTQSIEKGVWATPLRKNPPQPHDVLAQAFRDPLTERVILIFSVNRSKAWKGFAEMKSSPEIKPGEKASFEGLANDVDVQTRLSPLFSIEWKSYFPKPTEQGLPFPTSASDDPFQDVHHSRNCTEISLEIGKALCAEIDSHVSHAREQMRIDEEAKRLERESQQNHFFFLAAPSEHSSHSSQPSTTDPPLQWEPLFFAEVAKVGKLLFASYYGSRCFNLHTPESDIDLLAFFIAPTHEMLSFDPPKATIKNADFFRPDFTLHEIGFVCELLINGDTKIVESLWSHPSVRMYESVEWKEVREKMKREVIKDKKIRARILSKYLSEICGGRGLEKVAKMAGKETEKKEMKLWYIILRLVYVALKVARIKGEEGEEEMTIWMQDQSESREFLLGVRQCRYSREELKERVMTGVAEIEQRMKELSGESQEECFVEKEMREWLWRMRKQGLEETLHKHDRQPYFRWKGQRNMGRVVLMKDVKRKITVYAENTRVLLGFEEPPVKATSVEGDDYEVSRFCEMLLKSNPNCLEVLYAEDGSEDEEAWKWLKERREMFLTDLVVTRGAGLLKGLLRYKGKRKNPRNTNLEQEKKEVEEKAESGRRIERWLVQTVLEGKYQANSVVTDYDRWNEVVKWVEQSPKGKRRQEPDVSILRDWVKRIRCDVFLGEGH